MSALFVCKCLNVSLDCDKCEEITNIGKLELTSMEQRDSFFSEKLVSCHSNELKIYISQAALTGQRSAGRWTLNSCVACGQDTHAVSIDRPNLVLLKKSIQSTLERVNSLKKSKNYSPVFNILVPEVSNFDTKENMDISNMNRGDRGLVTSQQQVVGSLSKQLNQTLHSKLENVQETVRQFQEQKYAEYAAYRERAHRDHKILASIISAARKNSSDWSELAADSERADNGPPSPLLPPLQRRRLSSLKDAKKPLYNVKPQRSIPPEEDSLEVEDVFSLEGMDSQHNMISDQDDYDDSDDGSNDEGIHIGRPRGSSAAADIARSLPVNMPNFPQERQRREIDDDDEPHDIAASIKALARSVHGDQFELPRPRFSTQI